MCCVPWCYGILWGWLLPKDIFSAFTGIHVGRLKLWLLWKPREHSGVCRDLKHGMDLRLSCWPGWGRRSCLPCFLLMGAVWERCSYLSEAGCSPVFSPEDSPVQSSFRGRAAGKVAAWDFSALNQMRKVAEFWANPALQLLVRLRR